MAADMKLSVTLANSVIGVSVLAMPYCFHQVNLWSSMFTSRGAKSVAISSLKTADKDYCLNTKMAVAKLKKNLRLFY